MTLRYDKAAIMAKAWDYYRACQATGSTRTFGDCMRDTWLLARYEAYRWRYGYSTDLHLIFIVD